MQPSIIRSLYYEVMPKEPLIKDPGKRQLVIAIAMGCLLAASMITAVLISGAKLGL